MRSTTLFLTALLGMATALPLSGEESSLLLTDASARNNFIEELVLGIIEDLRALMINGSEEVPVLDPFQLDHIRLDLGELVGLDGSHVELADAVLDHLSSFEVDDLRITLTNIFQQRYTMVLDGHIPSLDVDANHYDLDVTILGVRIFGNGRLRLRILEPRITGTVILRISLLPLPITAFIESADVGFTLGGFESEFTGLFDGDAFLNDFVSAFLQNLVPEMIEFFEEEIRTTLSALIVSIGNDILASSEIVDVLGRINMEKIPQIAEPVELSKPVLVQ